MNHKANAVSAIRSKQAGQGMTEYIIIVALIAVAAIAVYGFFGDAIRAQMGTMTGAISGNAAATTAGKTGTNNAAVGATTAAVKKGDLQTYSAGGK